MASRTIAYQIDAFLTQLHPVVGDAPDIEQIVHEPGHQRDLSLDHVGDAVDDRIPLAAALHQRDGVADRRQRIAEFVGQHGQELVLATVGVA